MGFRRTAESDYKGISLQEPDLVFGRGCSSPIWHTDNDIWSLYCGAMTIETNERREQKGDSQFRLKLNKRIFAQNAFTVNLQILTNLKLTKTKCTQLKIKSHASHDVPRRCSAGGLIANLSTNCPYDHSIIQYTQSYNTYNTYNTCIQHQNVRNFKLPWSYSNSRRYSNSCALLSNHKAVVDQSVKRIAVKKRKTILPTWTKPPRPAHVYVIIQPDEKSYEMERVTVRNALDS